MNCKISDYNYPLPDERIAKFPLQERDKSKLLLYRHGEVGEDVFSNLPSYLPKGALMVFNNTKVIQARLHFRKPTGALIEIFLLEPVAPRDYEQMFQSRGECSWICLIGNQKKWKEGALHSQIAKRLPKQVTAKNSRSSSARLQSEAAQELSTLNSQLSTQLTAQRGAPCGTGIRIDFSWDNPDVSFSEILEAAGELPIPPYLNRETQESDKTTYQTVYSKIKGSVAAPTAGLHFTDRVLHDIDALGIEREEVTLHVGAGTFKPVKSETISGHEMHSEFISVKRSTIERIIAHGGRAVAVGTTSVRTLESLYYLGVRAYNHQPVTEVEQWEPYETSPSLTAVETLEALLAWMDDNGLDILHASTRIIIVPGYKYHIVERLITNFHQPQSTLLLLVSALIGNDWHKVYDYALTHDFRFLSYGDSSILIPTS